MLAVLPKIAVPLGGCRHNDIISLICELIGGDINDKALALQPRVRLIVAHPDNVSETFVTVDFEVPAKH
jgi:hypothetical protein